MKLRSVLQGGHGRRLRVRRGAAMVVAVGLAMLGGIAFTATSAQAGPDISKAWVCKYTGTPFVDEVLKNGNDGLVWVSDNALEVDDPALFKDGQSQSFVLAIATMGNTATDNMDKHTYTGTLQCPAPRDSVPVTPPTYVPPTCTAPGSIDLGNSIYYKWVLNTKTGVYTAVPNTAPGINKPYTLTGTLTFGPAPLDKLTGTACVITVLPPVYKEPTCTAIGTLSFPTPVGYTWVEKDGIYNAVVLDENYTLIGATGSFGPFPLAQLTGGVNCPIVIPDKPSISLEKFATVNETDGDLVAQDGESITYTFRVTNTGNVALTAVTVIDALAGVGTVTCPATTLAVGASFTCTAAAFLVTTANATGSDIVNVATASGQPPTGSRVEATDTVDTPTGVVTGEVVTVEPVTAPVEVAEGAVVTVAPVVAPAKVTQLAFTGAETVPLGLSGLLALLLGAGLVATARRQGRRANN